MDYYRDTITSQSWNLLTTLSRSYAFTLIGGWAVWLYTHQLKSKDIDMVIDLPVLPELRKNFFFTKNDRLKKYEIIQGPVHIDIYVPYWSDLGVPVEEILKETRISQGFRVPPVELLVLLKEVAYHARAGTGKGRKDIVDIASLLNLPGFDWTAYRTYRTSVTIPSLPALSTVLQPLTEVPELAFNRHEFSKKKKNWLAALPTS